MRRHLISTLLSFAVIVISGPAALAQGDATNRPSYYGSPSSPYTYDRYYDDDDRHDYRYGQAPYGQTPYVRPYDQPRPQPYPDYGQRAQRFGGLQILEAWYGRGRRVCDASHSMRRACEGQPGCEVKAGNELCGDPVPGTIKGLTVTYRCHGDVQRAEQREPGYIGLRC